MKNTKFVEPTGLDPRNVSSASDLVLLAVEAGKFNTISKLSSSPRKNFSVGKKVVEFRNSNALVRENVLGISLSKTGYILEAGRCLVMMVGPIGRRLIVVTLNAGGSGGRASDSKKLLLSGGLPFHQP